jgi:hypothetical protein
VASRAAAVADVSAATLAGSEYFSGEGREPSRPSRLVRRTCLQPHDERRCGWISRPLGTIFRLINKE